MFVSFNPIHEKSMNYLHNDKGYLRAVLPKGLHSTLTIGLNTLRVARIH